MIDFFPLKPGGNILRNPHFWAIIVITLALFIIYQAWPWTEWKLDSGMWQFFPRLPFLHHLAVFEYRFNIIGILFLIPIIYAAFAFSWQGALLVTLVSLLSVLLIIVDLWVSADLIVNIVLLLSPLFISLLVSFELKWRHREKQIFSEREAERRIYISRVLESQENERQRIARDLHDDTIHILLAVANTAQNMLAPDAVIKEIKRSSEWIRDTTLQAIEDLRRITVDLRPSILDHLGLIPALRWLADRINNESDIDVKVFINGEERELPSEVQLVIFRITQEALNNIKRHSGATEAAVTMEFANDSLKISIQDDGKGFRPPKRVLGLAAKGKLGLIGMHERIDSLGGKFQIYSRPGKGTLLFIEISY
jgi:signal transduction histidine kinase